MSKSNYTTLNKNELIKELVIENISREIQERTDIPCNLRELKEMQNNLNKLDILVRNFTPLINTEVHTSKNKIIPTEKLITYSILREDLTKNAHR